jgi:DNA invertase Pin-like site-specific DNA recombinase
MGYQVTGVISEQISGIKKNDERPELKKLLELINDGKVDRVLVWELSRLGRNVVEILQVVQKFNDSKVKLYIKNFNLETLNEDGSPNPLTMFMIQILLSVAEMERLQIRQRMQSGYLNFRKNGGKVGRQPGKKETSEAFLEKYSEVAKLLRKGISVRNVSKLTGATSSATIIKVKKLISK